MKPPAAARKLAIAIAFVLIAYAASYAFIQHRRVAKGPWEVTFTREAGVPALVVNQTRLGIANVRLVFSGAQAAKVLETVSLVNHYLDFEKGVVDSTHIIYYGAFIFLFLFFTVRRLEARRW